MSYTILLVEDNPHIMEINHEALMMEGYDVLEAKDGRECMARLKERDVDMIVLDIMLPDSDGLTLCRQIKAQYDIVLTPMQEARADYYNGDVCPSCGEPTIQVIPLNDDEHQIICSCGYEATEPHFGGEATYISQAMCDGCFEGYGPILEPSDWDTAYLVAGQYYLNKPQSVPQSYDCHYQMDWWTGPQPFGQLILIGEIAYYVDKLDTMVYKAAGPLYISKVTGTPATCTEPGVADYWKCSVCGRMYSEKACENEVTLEQLQSDALGHDLTETKEVPATCEEPGTEAYWTCQRDGCGKMFSDKDGKNEIDEPIAIDPLGHLWAVDTTYGDNGWDWRFNDDGSFSSTRVFLKCQRTGCGESTYKSVWNAYPVSKSYDEATGKVTTVYETAASLDGQRFSGTAEALSDPIPVNCVYLVAGEYYLNKPQSVPQSYDCHYQMDWWTYPEEFNQVVQIGGEFYLAANVDTMVYKPSILYVSKVTGTPATCTEDGIEDYWKCSVCGRMYSEKDCENQIQEPVTIQALGHDLVETKKMEPTCTEPGTEAYWTCQRDGCGKMFSDKDGEHEITEPVTIKAPGHDLVHHDAQAPTCTEIGWDAYDTCSRCDYTTYEEKAALDHDLIHHDAQAPTCTEIGWEAYDDCSRCDYTTYAEKAALGHDLIHHDAQDPTCTEIGWDAYDTCSRCDYTTYEEISALGHDLVHHDAQAPTCTAIGWDAYDTCSRCDYTTYVEIPALGHDYQITSRTITIIISTCSHCGDSAQTYNPSSRNLLDGLVRDGEGEPVDYSAGVSRVNGKRVLTVTPDPVDGEVSLYLTPEEAELWFKQGIDMVSFGTDFAALEIDLSEITAEWFPLEDGAEIDFFVFTLAPAENGAEVRVEALIGEEKTPAEAFTGIVLFLEDQEISVTENGEYRKE